MMKRDRESGRFFHGCGNNFLKFLFTHAKEKEFTITPSEEI